MTNRELTPGLRTTLSFSGSRLAAFALLTCLAAGLAAQAPAQSADAAPKRIAHPYTKQHIYSETANPEQDIAAALKQARKEHKHVLVDFGGDWCGDCQVLDLYFHEQANADLLAKGYVLVHVFIGHMDQHLDAARKYGVDATKGVPALAVLDATGKPLYAQPKSQFSDARYMQSASITDFLRRWMPKA